VLFTPKRSLKVLLPLHNWFLNWFRNVSKISVFTLLLVLLKQLWDLCAIYVKIHSALIFSSFTLKRSHTKLMTRSLIFELIFLFLTFVNPLHADIPLSIRKKNNLMQFSDITTTSQRPMILLQHQWYDWNCKMQELITDIFYL